MDNKTDAKIGEKKMQLSSEDKSEITVWKTGVVMREHNVELVYFEFLVSRDVPRTGHEPCSKCKTTHPYGYSVVDEARLMAIVDRSGTTYTRASALGLHDGRLWHVGEKVSIHDAQNAHNPAWTGHCCDVPSGIVVQRQKKHCVEQKCSIPSLLAALDSQIQFRHEQIRRFETCTANTWNRWRSQHDSLPKLMELIKNFVPTTTPDTKKGKDSKDAVDDVKEFEIPSHELKPFQELTVWKLGAVYNNDTVAVSGTHLTMNGEPAYTPVIIELRLAQFTRRVTQNKCGHSDCSMMRKSRVSKAHVVSIVDLNGKSYPSAVGFYKPLSYICNETVVPDSFDEVYTKKRRIV